ncbi:MAG: M10 family metallopeptidase C-terminal domain-containing protein, partial [Shimia sp.]
MKVTSPLYYVDALLTRDTGGISGSGSLYTVAHPILSWHPADTLGSGMTLTYSFLGTGDATQSGYASQAMTAQAQAATREILALLSEFTALSFVEVGVGGQIALGVTSLPAAGASFTAGLAYTQWYLQGAGPSHTHSYYFDGEVFLTDRFGYDQAPVRGGGSYETLMHEIGHVLGLKHPFEAPVLPAHEETTQYTLMSYTAAPNGQNAATFGLYDVAALQYLYGANLGTRTGDDTYTALQLANMGGNWTIWDAGGRDTLDAGASSQGAVLDLRQGAFSSMNGIADALVIAYGVDIEAAAGSPYADTITGNAGANTIEGGLGDDTIEGGAGQDTALFTGDRDDYAITDSGGVVTIADTRTVGATGTDRITGVELFAFHDGTLARADLLTPNTPPTVAVADQTLDADQWRKLSDVVVTGDADGDAIALYQIWDEPGARFNWWADGARRDATAGYTTADPSDIWFQGDPAAGDQTLWVRVHDGRDWSAWDAFVLTTTDPAAPPPPPANAAPVVAVADQVVGTGAWTRLSDVMTYADADGDPGALYEVWDDAGPRHNWWADGATRDAGTGYVTADLADIWFQ